MPMEKWIFEIKKKYFQHENTSTQEYPMLREGTNGVTGIEIRVLGYRCSVLKSIDFQFLSN